EAGGERLHGFLEEIAAVLPGAGEQCQRLFATLYLGDVGDEDDDAALAHRLLQHLKPGAVVQTALERAARPDMIRHAPAQPGLLVADGTREHPELDALAHEVLEAHARNEKRGAGRA